MTMVQAAAADYSLRGLTPEAALGDADLRQAWSDLTASVHPLNRMFASPAFFEASCQNARNDRNRVYVLRDGHRTIGVCPVVHWRITMPLQFRHRVLGRFTFDAATVQSGEPLLAGQPELLRRLFDALLGELEWCDCVFFPSLPADAPTCQFLYSAPYRSRSYFVHPRELEPREWLYLELGDSFDEFLRGKQKRTRNTLKRRVRKLREQGGGRLECQRVETEDQVDDFYAAARAVAEQSWQFHNLGRVSEETALSLESLRSLARMGCLRAYLLRCGDRPCAFVVGYQHGDVLQFEQTAYASEFGLFSPGTVLYYLLMEDLYAHRRPGYVNHGVGVTPHKRLFTNRSARDTTVYLFRPTTANRLRCLGHSFFTKGLLLAKRLLKRRRNVPTDSSELDEAGAAGSLADLAGSVP
jgi:CelD/BcsL family acetyltransferase involved in cellulose biosynthesis